MAKNTIIIRSASNIRDEKVATAVAITPGMLLERTSGDLVQAHSTAGGPTTRLFAMEDAFQGKKISDAYAVSVPIFILVCQTGDRVYAFIDDASAAEDVAISDYLESAGDGRLKKYTPQASGAAVEAAGAIVGIALSAQTTPGGRVIVEIF